MIYWRKLSHAEQDHRITSALENNIDYKNKISLGIPASKLDPFVFYDQAPFLRDAPLLRTYVQNPNHIGCHTLGDSELFFKGTQELEKEVIDLLSVDVFKAAKESCDGYVATGGTEANIQAIWMYRNIFLSEPEIGHKDIGIICSSDTHYSIPKASNLLNLKNYEVAVDHCSRKIVEDDLETIIDKALGEGIKRFIVVANMGTTMFGSVDEPDVYINSLQKRSLLFKLHIDGAFGGFIYPFSNENHTINFSNPHISSITLDAHKMLQAPYGTGIFLCRKGLMKYVYTQQAQYVHGMDITLSGSRSGANAIAIWMILSSYGPHGWFEKIQKLLYRTTWCCKQLDGLGVKYFRHPHMNIITIEAQFVSSEIALKYGLVPDAHGDNPNWYKIVVMDHVEINQLQDFLADLEMANKK